MGCANSSRRLNRPVCTQIELHPSNAHTSGVDDERAPICPTCGVTMAPAALSAQEPHDRDWVCLECEETAEPDTA